ncbi:peptidoglycan editing factor PgeF [Planctobacterium marinum]|uniref:Purine nucleoside phosphorylase n=1 Tax=Planctobacterium marinum TaxID=1631968 RepID=A0AA48HHY6_9ALTE|nr:laccase domain protein [Planctobacterium marinum]
MTAHFITPDWTAPSHVKAISTLRSGGTSSGVYDSLNLGLHVGDEEQRVVANRSSLPGPNKRLWLQQTHSCRVVKFGEGSIVGDNDNTAADGSFTFFKNHSCVVMTADCLPVLLTNKQGSFVAALHCGWRGLAGDIIQQCLLQLRSHIQSNGEVIAWLGPAIGPDAFEVGSDVLAAFPKQSSAFKAQPNDKYLADIFAIATMKLNLLGVTQVFSSNLCTWSDRQRFFSYRRDGQTGRMASLIWIE